MSFLRDRMKKMVKNACPLYHIQNKEHAIEKKLHLEISFSTSFKVGIHKWFKEISSACMSCATSKPMRFKARLAGIMSPVLSSVFHSLVEDSMNHAYIETLVSYVSRSAWALESKNTKCFTICPAIKFVFNALFWHFQDANINLWSTLP